MRTKDSFTFHNTILTISLVQLKTSLLKDYWYIETKLHNNFIRDLKYLIKLLIKLMYLPKDNLENIINQKN